MTLTAPSSTGSNAAVQADPSAGGPIPPSPAKGLICRNCGATFGLIAEHACAECFGPLEVDYDYDLLKAVTREQIEAGPQNIWRYVALLPVGQDPAERVTLDPGLTPLVRADRLAAELGLTGGLWVKDDSANPTHSFKDRVVMAPILTGSDPASRGWVECGAFHSSRGAEGHGPMKPRQPPSVRMRSGRCQFRPARLDGPARGR